MSLDAVVLHRGVEATKERLDAGPPRDGVICTEHESGVLWGAVLALASTAIATTADLSARWAIHVVPLTAFYVAILFSSWYGGRRSGLLALALAVLIQGTVVDARPGIFRLVGGVSLLVVGGVLVALVTSLQRANAMLRREHARDAFVVHATAVLARALDFDAALAAIAQLAVPAIADLCAIDLAADGSLRRVATVHANPAKLALVAELERRYPPAGGARRVVDSDAPDMREVIRPQQLAAAAVDDEHRKLLAELGFTSYISVPIRDRGRLIGVITVVMSDSRRHYTPGDLAMTSTLADRVGITIENARLFDELERARERAAAERDVVDDMRARAESASRAKDEFLAMLGHELRNPLAPIQSSLELMELRAPGVLERERAVISRQVKNLVRLVDDLLDVARITRGRTELHQQPIELAEVVATAVESTSPLFVERHHMLHVDVQPGLVVSGDLDRLAQVVANLLTNAAKYTEVGGRVAVTGSRQDGEAVLRVRDTGMGISAETLPRVFDLFVQERQTLDRARGGLGLGLAIVRNLVELHGGKVEATSEGLGRGSEFTVRLPLLARAAAVMDTPLREPATAAAAPGERVLVVDDNPDALAALSSVLEGHGFEIYPAPDGPAAIQLAQRVHPSVALLDIGLPGMDGYELARRLRELAPAMRLVAVTGYGQPSDIARSRAAGFGEHLVKPVTLAAVEAAIRHPAARG